MNIKQLTTLFSGLPSEIIKHFGDKEFKTCWYGSSGLDKRPMVFTDSSKPNTNFNDEIDVFFYTDIDFSIIYGALYSCYHKGKIIFKEFNENVGIEIQKLDGTISPMVENYALSGCEILADVSLNMGAIIPYNDNNINSEILTKSFTLRLKTNEYFSIVSELYPEIYEVGSIEILEKFDEGLWGQLGFGVNQSDRIKIKDWLDLKYSKKIIDARDTIHSKNFAVKSKILMHTRFNGAPFFTFYIEIDDNAFEQTLLHHNLRIDYAAKSQGWAGPGPSDKFKKILGWEWLNYHP
jgi:hypothetical protein